MTNVIQSGGSDSLRAIKFKKTNLKEMSEFKQQNMLKTFTKGIDALIGSHGNFVRVGKSFQRKKRMAGHEKFSMPFNTFKEPWSTCERFIRKHPMT